MELTCLRNFSLYLFKIKVNGETFEFPWMGRPFRFKPSVFGRHDKVEISPRPPVQPAYYCGRLNNRLEFGCVNGVQ